MSENATAQSATINEDIKNEMKTEKEEFIQKYSWTKSLFEKPTQDLLSISEFESEGGTKFIVVKSKESNVMYDADGKVYCTDNENLNCIDFYKFSPSTLNWSKA
jgi:uncharacterized membrane-anchored protein YhcB (DUF1043 family)